MDGSDCETGKFYAMDMDSIIRNDKRLQRLQRRPEKRQAICMINRETQTASQRFAAFWHATRNPRNPDRRGSKQMETNTDKILKTMFSRLLQIEVDPTMAVKLSAVIDSVLERIGGNLDLETVQGQNTFRALLCSMVVHGWGNGMHPFHNPGVNQDGHRLEVRVSKDILVLMQDLQALRYVKKDADGRVNKALFEPDQNIRVRQQIDDVLAEISQNKWGE